MDEKELMKIQILFGNEWVNLSDTELRERNNLKIKLRILREALDKGKEPPISLSVLGEDYFKNRLVICKKISEALNPDNWEDLGAVEIGKRIREFQNMMD